jgi:heme oxygenase
MILERLREETRPAHERLETRIDLLGRPWSRAFYISLLRKFYGFYAVLEPAIFACPEWKAQGFDTEGRHKLPLLRHDLLRLGLSPSTIESIPLCRNVPVPENFAQALGCAYVLEGSTLGGKIISRHLHQVLGGHTTGPQQGAEKTDIEKAATPASEGELSCAFFGCYGSQVGEMWRGFVAFLNSRELTAHEQDALVASASATFAMLEAWMLDILDFDSVTRTTNGYER